MSSWGSSVIDNFEIFVLSRIFFFKCSSKFSLVEHIFIEVRVLELVTSVLLFFRLLKKKNSILNLFKVANKQTWALRG